MFSEQTERSNIAIASPVSARACQMCKELVATSAQRITGRLLAEKVAKLVVAMKLVHEANNVTR